MRREHRIAFIGLILLLVVGVVGFRIISNLAARQTVTFSFSASDNQGFIVDIKKLNDGKVGGTVATLSANKALKLSPGKYRLISQHNTDYKDYNQDFTVDNSDFGVSIASTYATDKLVALLAAEQPAIAQTIATVPHLNELYTVNTGTLYRHGEWYGTTLTYKNTSDRKKSDTLRLVARKQNNSWQLVTNPPQILISYITHNDIPRDILVDVNKLK